MLLSKNVCFGTSYRRFSPHETVRYCVCVYQHVLLDVFDSPAKCSNLATFHGSNSTPPTATPNPSSTFDPRMHIPGKAMRQQQGKKRMGTSWFVLVSKLTWFSYIAVGLAVTPPTSGVTPCCYTTVRTAIQWEIDDTLWGWELILIIHCFAINSHRSHFISSPLQTVWCNNTQHTTTKPHTTINL
jgi:hypothetical protein